MNSNELERLTNFVTLLTEATSRDALIQVTLTGIFGLLPADIVEANLIDPLDGRIIPHRLAAPHISRAFQRGARSSYAVGEGFTGWLIEHGGILHIADCLEVEDPRPASAADEFPFRSFLGSTLQAGDGLIGTLELAHHEPNMYTAEHLAVFQLAIAQVGAALRSLRLDAENKKHTRLITALQELRAHGWWDEAGGNRGRKALELIASQLEVDLLIEFAYEEDMNKLRYSSGAPSVHAPPLERWVLDTNPTTTLGSVLRTHDYWLSNSIGEDPVFSELGLPPEAVSGPIKHLLFAPLGSKGEPAGMLFAARTSELRAFDISEAELFVALAQEYSRLHESAGHEHAPIPQAGALDPARPAKETKLDLQRTESLLRLAAEISTSLDLERGPGSDAPDSDRSDAR